MATRYEIRTFSDVVRAVLETLKVQASDVETTNRIKRNINMIYLNHVVPASNSWTWLNETVTVGVEPYFDAGTIYVQQNLAVVTMTQSIATSVAGRYLTLNDGNEIYKIATHAPGSNVLTLESPYNGPTLTAGRYKIWTDETILPSDCMKVKEVISANASQPLQNVAIQQFRKHQISGGALIGSPTFYCEGGMRDPSPYAPIVGLSAVVSRMSAGLNKQLTFAQNVANFISIGDRIHVDSPSSYQYEGDFIVSGVSGTTISYTGRVDFTEATTTDATIVLSALNTTNTAPAPVLLVHPAIQQRNQRINLVVDYQAYPSELIADRDEPRIPREHRSVLFFGAMWLSSDRETDLDRSDRYRLLMETELQRMITRASSTPKTPTMRVSESYLRTKRGRGGNARYSSLIGTEGFGSPFGMSGGSGNAPTATGTPSSVAVFDENGYLVGSSDIDLNLLEYLIGTQATGSKVALDNATLQVDMFDAIKYKSADVQYVIKRGTSYRGGHFVVVTDGTVINYADYGPTEIGSPGATFTADLIAGFFRINMTLDSQGVSGTLYYKVSLV